MGLWKLNWLDIVPLGTCEVKEHVMTFFFEENTTPHCTSPNATDLAQQFGGRKQKKAPLFSHSWKTFYLFLFWINMFCFAIDRHRFRISTAAPYGRKSAGYAFQQSQIVSSPLIQLPGSDCCQCGQWKRKQWAAEERCSLCKITPLLEISICMCCSK